MHRLFLAGRDPRDHPPRRRAGGGRGRHLPGAGARRLRGRAPTAATATRWPRARRPRRWWPRCSAGPRGVCGGRAGSMNVIDLEHGLVGCYGIVGGSIAAALGASLSAKRQGRVAVAFFGDGATNQAYFHECLNMAQVFSLPAVFVCENNFYGEFTPMGAVTAGADIAGRARAYDMPSEVVDGNDLWAVHAAAAEAVDARPRRRRPDAARVPDLPPLRPLQVRPGRLPAQGGGRALARARSAQARPRAAARGGRGRGGDRRHRGGDDRAHGRTAVQAAAGRALPRPGRRARDGVRGHEHARVPRRDPRRAGRGARARPVGRLLRRGHRRGRRRVQGDARPGRALRPRARVRHADLRARARRRRLRRRGHGPASGVRDHVRRLHGAGHGQPGQPGGQVLVHLQRAGQRSARGALGGRRRRSVRRDPLPDPRHVVSGRARA